MTTRNRKLTRLRDYDYSQNGYYFITICVKERLCVFGKISDGTFLPSKFADIVRQCWFDLPNHYPNCVLHAFTIMPNHFHGIIENRQRQIDRGEWLEIAFPPTRLVRNGAGSQIVFISAHHEIYDGRFRWQKSFYDHIIRSEESLIKISEYILHNSAKWHEDRFYIE